MEYYEHECKESDFILGFKLTGREIDYFYDPSNSFDYEIDTNNTSFLLKKFNAEQKKENMGTYWHKGDEIKVSLATYSTYYFNSDTPIKAQSSIKVKFSEMKNIEFVLDVIYHCKKFLFFISRRSNIQLDDIQLYGFRDGKERIIGILHECMKRNEEETDLNKRDKIIKYDYLKEKSILLFPAIEDDSMYFEHLQSCISKTKSYGVDRIILNFVAFEREFRNIYNDEFVRSKEYEDIKNQILNTLDEMKNTKQGKEKDYVKEFIRTISKRENSFSDKMKKALEDCQEILLPFLKYDYCGYNSNMINNIAERMNKLRNDSAHGNIDLNIEPINMADFSTLENLLYAMRLKKIGVDDINVKRAIKSLKGYNLRLES